MNISLQVKSVVLPVAQVIYVVGVLKKRLRIPDSCPDALRQLICECWQDDADLRPPFSDIVPRLEVTLPAVGGTASQR